MCIPLHAFEFIENLFKTIFKYNGNFNIFVQNLFSEPFCVGLSIGILYKM